MGSDDFFDNLLRATNNLNDISFSRYGTITRVLGDKCSVQEFDSNLLHENVPLLVNGVKKGDKVLIGFVGNSLHNPIVFGVIGGVKTSEELMILAMGCGLFKIKDDGKLYVELPVGMENIFSINENGVLCVELPDGADNDYSIREDGMLTYRRDD